MARDLNEGIALIGTGRMAYHLGHAIMRAGLPLVAVAGRDAGRTKALALELRSTPYGIEEPWPVAAVYLIAVSDDAVKELAARITKRDAVVAMTSGALQREEVLQGHPHRGVLWPIKSLSPGSPADLSSTPLVVDATPGPAHELLMDLARSISGKVVELPSEKRRLLHLAAVFTSNFPVYLAHVGNGLLTRQGLDPGLLSSLWTDVSRKVSEVGPEQALTGPARRGDVRTLAEHLERLEGDADLRAAYSLLSRMILKEFHPEKDRKALKVDDAPDL